MLLSAFRDEVKLTAGYDFVTAAKIYSAVLFLSLSQDHVGLNSIVSHNSMSQVHMHIEAFAIASIALAMRKRLILD